ncbi:MAG: type VI secretion system tube protein Hcp [Caldimonas sp.]
MARASQFLKLIDDKGDQVDGESLDDKHEKQIDLTTWNWDVTDPAVPVKASRDDADAAGNASSAKPKAKERGDSDTKPQPSIFGFSKATDRSTTRLLSAMDRGEVFPKAVVTIEEKYEESPLPFFLEITLTDVFITQFDWRLTAESARATMEEDWKLNYSKIFFAYHWRGGDAGWIHQTFDRPPDTSENESKKAPLSAAEQSDALEQSVTAIMKKAGKK